MQSEQILNSQLHKTPIAIIGMASIFPKAKNLQEYWNNIIKKIDCITDVPISRWNIDDYYDPDQTAPDKTYCKRGGFIPNIDFNPMEFGLPPNILEVTDVSQLLSLVVTRDALIDAGYYKAAQEILNRTGVVLGVGGGQKLITPLTCRLQYPVWRKVLKSSGLSDNEIEPIVDKMKMAYIRWEENSFPGMLGNVIAGRVANRFNLGGINCVVDAACASSLSAIRLAISELTEHRSDMMISGGVDTDNSIFMYLCFSKTPAFSKSDRVRTFDTNSDGMMIGEGLGMLILKRLEDAKRDNDRIYAIIKGIGASSDGKYKSIYAPRPQGQSLALQRAYADAGFEPNTIGLLEAHGTGTIAGDPSEIIALKSIFRNNSNEGQRIALGSVKSQIGHTKSAAGAAGMIKAALALHHKILPATINVSTPNPKYEIENSSFYINSETRPWLRADSAHPRRAGISAFGFGGTNFHIVLEEYNGEHAQPYRIHQVPQSIMLAAKTMPRLLAHITDLLASLDSETAEDNFAHIVAESKKINIEFDMPRLGFVAETPEEAKSLLEIARQKLQKNPGSEAWNHPKGIFYRQSHLNPNGKIVALFSGQGSQYVDMGRELFLNFPPMRQTLGKLDEHFLDDGLKPVSKVIFPPPAFDEHTHSNQTAALQNTEYAQPAIGVVSAALYKILHGAGFQPDFVAGHSFGELTALWAGNTLNDHDFFQLIKARGQAMAAPNRTNFDSGKMLAIKGDVNRLENDLRQFPDIIMANFNSPSQVVLAGSTFAIAEIEKTLKDKGYHVVSLPVSAAFHTPLVKHAQKPFAQAINKATFSSPKIAVYSNSTGGRYSNSPVTIKQTLADHILKPVLFKKQIENIYQAGGYFFVEFGPRSILTNLVKEILKDKPHIALSLNASRRKNSDLQLRTAVVQLRVMGFPLKDIDPYGYVLARLEKPKRKTLNIHLSGQNYVSEKTQAAFEDVIKHDVTSSHNMSNNNQSVINNPTDHHPPSSQEIIHKPTPKPSENHKINVTIHSPSLVDPHPSSSTTRKEERLEVGGERLQIKRVKPEMKPTIPKTDKISVRQPKPKPVPPDVISSHAPPTMLKSDYQELVSDLEGRLQKIQSHQTETLQVHEQYLTNQVEYSKTFFQLMREQQQMLARVTDKGTLSPEVVSSLERSMLTFHEHQTDTLRVHEAYLNNQIEYTKQFFDLTQHESDVGIDVSDKPIARSPHSYIQKPAQAKPTIYVKPIISSEVVPLSPQPKPVATVPMPSNDAIAQTLLDVVSEKTGYPNDMLTMDMDVEVDLGVDSIKRVEILGELQSHYPELPQVSMDDLGSLRTLAQIVDYVHGLGVRSSEFGDERSDVKVQSWELGVGSPEFEGNGRELSFSGDQVFEIDYDEKLESESQELGVGGWEFEVGSSKSEIKPSVDFGQIQDGLLQVVSEKTGYPIDMLDVDMDMEADLGIDSIKRVEIFGAMQDMFPELPAIDLDKLTDLRTLQQVIENVGGQDSSVKASFDPPGFNASDGGSVKARFDAPRFDAPDGGSVKASFDAQGFDDSLQDSMLNIVSEKTGYPSDMLDLDMDMEADLGIDSIKRVEIFGAMQDMFPDMPAVDPDELTDLQTLRQVIEHFGSQESGGATKQDSSVKASVDAPGFDDSLQDSMLNIVSEKTGYPSDMLDLDMDMESDFGIDSIKRVEILGAMQDNYPDMPNIDMEELAELRTLQQIIDHLSQLTSHSTDILSVPTHAPQIRRILNHNIKRGLASLSPLSPPDFLEFQLPPNHVCLITDDGSPITVNLAQKLMADGEKVVVLSFPTSIGHSKLPHQVRRVVLKNLTENHLKELIANISNKLGPIGAFIHLHPVMPPPRSKKHVLNYLEKDKEIVKHVFLMAKLMKKPLINAAQHGRSMFVTITRLDGEFGLSGQNFGAVGGGLFGLTKTLSQEWDDVFCRAIDLSPTLNARQVTQQIIAELHDPNRFLTETAYNSAGRMTLVREIQNGHNVYSTRKSIDRSDVFLVSGGAKGITAQCVVHLAEMYQCKFILLGRSAIDQLEPEWSKGFTEKPALKRQIIQQLKAQGGKVTPRQVQSVLRSILSKREIESTLHAIRQAGAQAEYVNVDIQDRPTLHAKVSDTVRRFGQVTGIIHGAGLLADKLIEHKTEQDFERVYAVKVTGLENLLRIVSAEQLKHIVLFSSVAGFYGNVGQSDYAIANEILNKSAYLLKRHYPNCHVVAINWGPWDGGMVTSDIKQRFEERNIAIIPIEVGTQMLADELSQNNHDAVQVIIGGPM